ncbi:putative a1 cistron-splicing factor aar2 [Diplodia seriata]|uniref:Putative a1 cistron-splicing factor aar2 n=1 Tax=Diplodia seriata TaxID=420778 RepID=A0A0G2EFM0_9PEZI|nr:putative a1 cistron-splicing factor aar2 [Diplodia seriata]
MSTSTAARPEDVAFNRVSVALARSQNLVASWLPPRPAEDEAAQKTPEQLHKEESALFTPGSDILGVGAEPPKDILDGSFKRNQLSSNERLRYQILGKNAAKGRGAQPADQKSAAAAHLPSKKLERPTKPTKAQDDSDDEDGRAAMFKSKRKAPPASVKERSSNGGDNELLEERSKKKNKKQKVQAGVPVKAAVEKSKTDSREEKPTAKAESPAAGEEGPDGCNDETDKAITKSAPAKVSIQHGESGDPVTTAENALLCRSDKKKKKKKKKKNKGEVMEQA